MLRVERIHAGYKSSEVLHGIDLWLEAGEVVTLLGRNGMGKTTTIRCICGLLPIYRGSIELDGRAIERMDSFRIARLGLGLVPEGRQIFPNLSVAENLQVAAANYSDTTEPWTQARQTPRSLCLGMKLAAKTGDSDSVASYALALNNLFPDSPEAAGCKVES